MGKYINETTNGHLGSSFAEKCLGLIKDGATPVEPTSFQPNLVCVVDSYAFGAAGYAYDEAEFRAFNVKSDDRPKKWFIYEKAEQFAG